MKTNSKGFTLVELLVVIGIIALLISILLPSLNRARQQALQTACAANMRSVGQAVAIYQSNFKGSLPPAWSWKSGSNHYNMHVWQLLQIPIKSNVRYCPALRSILTTGFTVPASREPQENLVSYLYNQVIAGNEQGTTANGLSDRIPHPVESPIGSGNYYARPMRAVPAASETAMFAESARLVMVNTDYKSSAPSDRGMFNLGLRGKNPLRGTFDNEDHQIFVDMSPVHILKPTSAAQKFLGTLPAREGFINVCYADGSVRAQLVKQGQVGMSQAFNIGVLALADDSTQNGIGLPHCQAVIPETRLDPFQSP